MREDKLPTVVFGEVLREMRTARSMTQDQLAELAETERSHISSLERAEKAPSLATLLTLAAALGVSAAELIEHVEVQLTRRRKGSAKQPPKAP